MFYGLVDEVMVYLCRCASRDTSHYHVTMRRVAVLACAALAADAHKAKTDAPAVSCHETDNRKLW